MYVKPLTWLLGCGGPGLGGPPKEFGGAGPLCPDGGPDGGPDVFMAGLGGNPGL